MLVDVFLRPRDQSRGVYDAQGFGLAGRRYLVRLYPRDQSRGTYDVQLRAESLLVVDAVAPPPGFPTQFSGLKIQKTGSVIELCLVAEADAPAGMGGVLKLRKGGVTYAVYLVETVDSNASPLRIRTTTGTKAVRLKT